LITFSANVNNHPLSEVAVQTILPNCPIYRHFGIPSGGGFSTFWTAVVNHFLSRDSFRLLSDRCFRPEVQLWHFELLFFLGKNLPSHHNSTFSIKPIGDVLPHFFDVFDGLEENYHLTVSQKYSSA
jgi:hypothetical protein